MDAVNLKELLDACFVAKRIVETLPELPKGMKPRHIHVLDRIGMACEEKGECRVSDVSEGLGTTMPSITKLIQELETMGLVEKYQDRVDKRVILLSLTESGRACVKKYVYDFQSKWAENLSHIPNEQAQETIRLIRQLDGTMPGKQQTFENAQNDLRA